VLPGFVSLRKDRFIGLAGLLYSARQGEADGSVQTLREYINSKAGHRDQKSLTNALNAWFAEVQKATWKNSDDIKRSYTWASIVSADRVVFDILTNRYRLVTAVDFEKSIVWIKWIGTHKEYDTIDVKKVKYARH
jgi:mRNA interferase HigB